MLKFNYDKSRPIKEVIAERIAAMKRREAAKTELVNKILSKPKKK